MLARLPHYTLWLCGYVASSHALHRQSINDYSMRCPALGILDGTEMTAPLFTVLNCNTLELIFSNHPFSAGIPLILPMWGNHSAPAWALPVTGSFLPSKKAISYEALVLSPETRRFLIHIECVKATH